MHRFAFTGGSPKAELHKLHKGLYAVYSVLPWWEKTALATLESPELIDCGLATEGEFMRLPEVSVGQLVGRPGGGDSIDRWFAYGNSNCRHMMLVLRMNGARMMPGKTP